MLEFVKGQKNNSYNLPKTAIKRVEDNRKKQVKNNVSNKASPSFSTPQQEIKRGAARVSPNRKKSSLKTIKTVKTVRFKDNDGENNTNATVAHQQSKKSDQKQDNLPSNKKLTSTTGSRLPKVSKDEKKQEVRHLKN